MAYSKRELRLAQFFGGREVRRAMERRGEDWRNDPEVAALIADYQKRRRGRSDRTEWSEPRVGKTVELARGVHMHTEWSVHPAVEEIADAVPRDQLAKLAGLKSLLTVRNVFGTVAWFIGLAWILRAITFFTSVAVGEGSLLAWLITVPLVALLALLLVLAVRMVFRIRTVLSRAGAAGESDL